MEGTSRLSALVPLRANGQFEKTIVSSLAAMVARRNSSEWDLCVQQIQSALNPANNKGINSTLLQVLIGCNTKHIAELRIFNNFQNVVQLDWNQLRNSILK